MAESRANACGITTIVIWCLTPTMLALTGDVPPFLIGAFSFLAAFAAACAWWIYRGESILAKFRMPLAAYALGAYGICGYNALYIYAFKTGPSLEVNLMNYLWPAFLIIFGSLAMHKKPDAPALIGIGLCIVGAFFVFKSRGMLDFSGSHLMLLIGLFCGMLWGSYSALSKFVPTNMDRIAIFFLMAGSVMLILHLALETTIWPKNIINWMMLIAYTLSRIAFCLWDYAMKHGQARLMGSLSYFIPLFATLFLMMAGFGSYNSYLLLGAALIVTGCIVINIRAVLNNITAPSRRSSA